MQKSTFKKVIGFIIRITLFAACIRILFETGMEGNTLRTARRLCAGYTL
ncbi:MAG: hypothetical protein LBJ58_01375 [Tannerellaceae bacterium]|jgi:hypothetical protein|nr:hypothetical protein [Tannerellaceae bacterium]